jgi:hypothetical protein
MGTTIRVLIGSILLLAFVHAAPVPAAAERKFEGICLEIG